MRKTLLLVLPALALLLPQAAAAAETTGRGVNVAPVKNLAYPNINTPAEVNAGTDLEFAEIGGREYAFTGTYGDGMQIIDISDPSAPRIVSTYDCGVSQGDVQVFQRPDLDGRWFVTYTMDIAYDFRASKCGRDLGISGARTAGTFIAEVTDPENPTTIAHVPVDQGSHNMTVHPSGKYLYNSNSDLLTSLAFSGVPGVEIFDIADPAKPKALGSVELTPFPGLGTESHDLTFSKDGKRAYTAALSHGEIIDTTDPAKPKVVGKIFDPAVNVWHQMEAITITDPVLGKRTFILAEDEVAGALGTGQCPNGGVHVYDATGPLEAAPVKVGVWNIDDVGATEDNNPTLGAAFALEALGTCTAHVFQLDHEQQLMTIAYYNGGVRVVDLKGLVGVALGERGVGMKQLGWYRFKDSNTWAVKAPKMRRDRPFFLYGNDHRRGFDVYKYTPAGFTPGNGKGKSRAQTKVDPGRWLTAAESLRIARQTKASGDLPVLRAVCLLGKRGSRPGLKAAAAREGFRLAG